MISLFGIILKKFISEDLSHLFLVLSILDGGAFVIPVDLDLLLHKFITNCYHGDINGVVDRLV